MARAIRTLGFRTLLSFRKLSKDEGAGLRLAPGDKR
jgi:hypothetical protein